MLLIGNKIGEAVEFEEKQKWEKPLARYVRDFNERHDNMTITMLCPSDEAGAPHALQCCSNMQV